MRTLIGLLVVLAACGGDDAKPIDAAIDVAIDSPNTTTITVNFYHTQFPDRVAANPAFAATRDGSGAWQPLAVTAGLATFPTTGTYTIATVCTTSVPVIVNVFTATVADGTDTEFDCNQPGSGATVSGTVSGIAGGQEGTIKFSKISPVPVMTDGGTYSQNVHAGSFDMIAVLRPTTTDFQGAKVIMLRAQPLADATMVNFNFATQGFTPTVASAQISGLVADDSSPTLTTNFGSYGPAGASAVLSTVHAASGNYSAADASQFTGAYDFQAVSGTGISPTMGTRQIGHYFHTPSIATQGLVLPTPLAAPSVTAAGTPYRFAATVPAYANAQQYSCAVGQTNVSWNLVVSAAAAGSGTIDLGEPDLSGVAGFDAAWELQPATFTAWTVSARRYVPAAPAVLMHSITVVVPAIGTDLETASFSGTL